MARRPTNVNVYVGRMIAQRRKIMRLSVTKLAQKIEVTEVELEDFERGTVKPHPRVFARIAEALEVPLSYFYTTIPHDLRHRKPKK